MDKMTRAKALFHLLDRARSEAAIASQRYPQPNYNVTKVAEEAGEVVKEAVHLAEDRGSAQAVEAEIIQAMAMLIRLYVEGDEVHGVPSIADALYGEAARGVTT
ncbi:MAG: hypothetical protein AAF376_18445 [Pseudomonadota bacterium]